MSFKNALSLAGLLLLTVPTQLAAQRNGSLQTGPFVKSYSIEEIGTFGGNVSEIFGLNNGGRVTGWAETPDVDPTGCFGSGGLIFRGYLWRDGTIHEIGTFGGNNSQSNAINAKGAAVGFAETPNLDPNFPPCLTTNAFLFQRGVLTNLGTLDAGNNSEALGLNSEGQVVGFSETGAFDPNFGVPLIHAFFWSNGVLTELPTLGGANAAAGAVSESGLILGFSETSTDIDPLLGFPDYHAALWSHGRAVDMGTLGGTISGVGISGLPFFLSLNSNNGGQVTGYAQTAIASSDPVPQFTTFTPVPAPVFSNEVHAFRWENGAMHDLGTLGGGFSQGVALNDHGHAAGMSTSDHSPDPDNMAWFGVPFPKIHAALWRQGRVVDLGTLGGPVAETRAINDRDQVVGWSVLSDNATIDAFLWQGGVMVDLNTVIPPNSGWQLILASTINARGQIGGVGFLNGELRAFLLTPSQSSNVAGSVTPSSTRPAISASKILENMPHAQRGFHRMYQ